MRHWFHQIPLPWRYQRYMFIHMTDRDNRNKEDPFYAVPRAVPMGWILAPIIAQCCTYALLLADGGEDRQIDANADLPIESLKKLEKEDGPPTWIPLNRGGGIFVLLDNILIVTPVKEVAEFWLRRLAVASQDYHAAFSNSKVERKFVRTTITTNCTTNSKLSAITKCYLLPRNDAAKKNLSLHSSESIGGMNNIESASTKRQTDVAPPRSSLSLLRQINRLERHP